MRNRLVSRIPVFFAIAALSCGSAALGAGAIKDAESASHADTSATYQVVKEYGYPGFKIVQYNLAVLSHYSYILLSDGQALVIDPGRDVSVYVDAIKKENAAIKGVFLTHSHADFVAGHMELANATGCPIYVNASSGAGYKFEPLKEGATLEIGQATVKFLETPGHTPDGLCAVVYGAGKSDPAVVFTGDTLFVGSVGRPDLLGGTMSGSTLAGMMYDSWMNKLSRLPDSTVVLPAHGAGSLCGAHLSDSPSSTIGAERASNPSLQHKSRNDFIIADLEGLPEAPQYFKHNAAMNRKGPDLVNWQVVPTEVAATTALTDASKYYVADLRSAAEYAAGHIPNSVNIALRGRLETWVGIMVPWDAKLVVAGSAAEVKEAVFRLHRVGYGAGVLTMDSWIRAGLPVNKNSVITPADLYALMQKGQAPVLVDVRLPSEWMGLRIGNVLNLPLNHLDTLSSVLEPTLPVVTICNSAYRSSMGIGVLERKGFQDVRSMAGGSEAWIEAGLPVFGADVQKTATVTATPKREVNLPDRIDPAALKRLMMDLPGTFDLVDVRPAAQFADFNLPGATNVDIADLMGNPAWLTGAGPLIIVDRDGSLAMAVGGILSQKTQRKIKVLFGGLEAYWKESTLGAPSGTGAPPATSAPARVPAPQAAPAPRRPPSDPAAPQAPEPPKKKSAGC